MKTEKEIRTWLDQAKEPCEGVTTARGYYFTEGFIAALKWVLEEDDNNRGGIEK